MPFVLSVAGEEDVVLADAGGVVEAVLRLVRAGRRPIGVGAGLLSGAPGRGGPAVLAASRALVVAARRPGRVAVRGPQPAEAQDAEAVLSALAVLVARRSAAAWAAVDLLVAGRTQAAAAAELGVSRQAVGQRLTAGGWDLERDLRPTATRLLARAEA
ncbi:hypothetical protein [Blastococcus sp. TF02A-26]|uniref:hypothetical protein n=1 Tax=Blastococcus sp. TF02A-26 TaxID=2250577 RepID=UPI000DEA2E46|nr:hypothetical protein [Blastococcus sp. TF02A-26]RBY90734.1 hypothetical protein DQ240_01335 [Blastococcus sp. TF02A-26]